MDLDLVDSGEGASYAAARAVARQEILGIAADGREHNDGLDWRAAVRRHPFFGEVTSSAQAEASTLGNVLGTAIGILQTLKRRVAGDNDGRDSGRQRDDTNELLDAVLMFRDLYLASPVPTAVALRARIAANNREGDGALAGAPDEADDGSTATEALRQTIRRVVAALKRGSLREPFALVYCSDDNDCAVPPHQPARQRAARLMKVLETFVDQSKSLRVDDW